jgi:hypothetical protein
MSIEGLWKFQSGSVDNPARLEWGGVITLESGRVLGGDSFMAYVGNYSVDRGRITAKVRAFQWNFDAGEVTNVFHMQGNIDFQAIVEGQLDGASKIAGTLAAEQEPQLKLQLRMEKIAELP